jgi:lipopolysaccharide export LptBFGC system permease protein LptF
MTGSAYQVGSPATAPPRRIFLSPFGWYTRYMLRALLQQTFVATVGILIVALTVDLAPQLRQVLADGPEGEGVWVVVRLAWYLLLRSMDFAPRLLPIGCFLGVMTCEFSHTWSRERLAVWNSGRSPLQCLVPALILSVLAGFIQIGFDAYLRPAAVAAQIDEHLGEYGERFDRRPTQSQVWVTAGNNLVAAQVEFGPPPLLRDAMIYRLRPDGRLYEIVTAKEARPGPGRNLWNASGVSQWNISDGDQPGNATGGRPAKSQESAEIVLPLDPLWLSNFRLSPMFMPQHMLTQLANTDGLPRHRYQTWIEVRYADMILPAGMVLLATSLSLLLLPYGASFNAMVGMALAGYAGHVSMRAFVLLGEHGYVQPTVAAWTTPVLQLIAASIILVIVQLRRKRVRVVPRAAFAPLRERRQRLPL